MKNGLIQMIGLSFMLTTGLTAVASPTLFNIQCYQEGTTSQYKVAAAFLLANSNTINVNGDSSRTFWVPATNGCNVTRVDGAPIFAKCGADLHSGMVLTVKPGIFLMDSGKSGEGHAFHADVCRVE